MRFPVNGAPHLPPKPRVNRLMGQVVLALLPAIAAHWWFFGWGIAIQIALACLFALGFEWGMLRLRQRRPRLFLTDGSALVTAVLFALCLPPLSPWWVSATGMLFAIVVAKHLYGGLGYNLFNPAMVGLAAVIIAFPTELSQWLTPRGPASAPPGLTESLLTVFSGVPPERLAWEALTSATPLELVRTGLQDQLLMSEIRTHPVFGTLGGRGWDWIGLATLLGGLWLVWQRVIGWHVPAAVILTTLLVTLPLWLIAPDLHASPLSQLFSGGLLLCAFFIATDPVSGSATPRGKLLFGAGVAILTLAIRRWGGFPDGVAFAVLLMNMLVPLIDRYTRPRVYGYAR
ncbi:RnfABCDGE type electron transport complex subunit D [Wenzhouxiangella limi]|uniref:Ion-translocating oxidoreductase complex subunit D n=1 Tax=Wenzhouxiangella limi TaxID=2707351 RepID=A0A845UZL7_9GAMM|nr:RnfABCDGE type electron transport complex subunit D [Wenzhouxiangella limi]NDY95370.1 RnfABCDGE type electron transport complex subunit D [Wenzhouxiangella limi]